MSGSAKLPEQGAANLRDLTHFGFSPLLETCYALAHITGPGSRDEIHGPWSKAARKRLPGSFWSLHREIGGWPLMWISVPDTLSPGVLHGSFEKAGGALKSLPTRKFIVDLLEGVLHDFSLAERLLEGNLSLEQAVASVPPTKREWLLFTGLYPFDSASPAARTLQHAIDDPDGFHGAVVRLLSAFWKTVFKDTWTSVLPQLQSSLDEKSRLWAATTPQQFADTVRLRIEIDSKKERIRAVRGGGSTAFAELREVWMMPSVFNVNHFWHAIAEDGVTSAYFPYFDPAINVGLGPVQKRRVTRQAGTSVEPPLVFKALGDVTRYAMVMLVAQGPRTATELGTALSLSKGTISHHVHILLEANVLTQTAHGNSVILGVNKSTLEQLSKAAIAELFESTAQGRSGSPRAPESTGD